MRKITLLPLALSLCAAAALAEDPQSPPGLQLAAEAKALCESQTAQPVAKCARETLGEDGVESVQQAIDAEHRKLSDAYYTEVAEQLLKREQPRATLLGARLLRWTVDFRLGGPQRDEEAKATRARIAELVRAAALRAEDDPLVQWTLAAAFRRELPDIAAAAATRLRVREADNLAVFFLDDGTRGWTSERIQQAAATQRFNLPFFDLIRSDLEWLAAFEPPRWMLKPPGKRRYEAIELHQMYAAGLQMAESLPSLHGLTRACTPGQDRWQSGHRSYCERIATMLTGRSNSLLGWGVGIALLDGLADTPEKRLAAEVARRTYRYQTESIMAAQLTNDGEAAGMRALREPGVDEIVVIRRHLASQDLPTEPPADWQPMTHEQLQAQLAAGRAESEE